MQTFVTATIERIDLVEVCRETAAVLDSPRLGKQRVEAKQILTALQTGTGWVHHPATKMWRGHELALAIYGWYVCLEWQRRGFKDNLGDWFADQMGEGLTGSQRLTAFPWWFGNAKMVATHRSKLIGKSPLYYEKLLYDGGLWSAEDDSTPIDYMLPYLWPDPEEEGVFSISGAEWRRRDGRLWNVPPNWTVNECNRRVSFS